MSWPPDSESDFPWLPIPEEGISPEIDPQLYGLPADYHILPEDLRAQARSQRLALSLTSSNREVPANIPGPSTSQQSTTHPGSPGREGELSNILHQPVMSPAIGGDGSLEDDCRKNPNMQLFIQRHPSPTIQNRAVRRDVVARRTLGELYQQYNQDAYNVIEKRTNMTQDVETRDQELHGGMQWFKPAGNENGKLKPKHYCRSCEEWFWDWRCRHIMFCHMQDPDNDEDTLLICPVNLLGLRSPLRAYRSMQDIASAHMLKHPHS